MIHVYPINDEREHDLDGTMCPCEPHVEWSDPETGEPYAQALVIHRAFDGRDVIEEAERIISNPDSILASGTGRGGASLGSRSTA